MGRQGFSLMDIMIIVAVLALLAAIAVPNFVNVKRKSETHFCVHNLSILREAKKHWAKEPEKPKGAICSWSMIKGHIPQDSSLGSCLAGGSYTIGPAGEDPQCSIGKDHSLS